MSYKPRTLTPGQAETRFGLVYVLAAQSVYILVGLIVSIVFHADFIASSQAAVSQVFQASSDLATNSWSAPDASGLVIMSSHDTGVPRELFVSAGDALVCVETDDLDSLEEDSGHPQAFPEPSLIRLGEFSGHDSPRAPFLPFLPIHGLMSRRF